MSKGRVGWEGSAEEPVAALDAIDGSGERIHVAKVRRNKTALRERRLATQPSAGFA